MSRLSQFTTLVDAPSPLKGKVGVDSSAFDRSASTDVVLHYMMCLLFSPSFANSEVQPVFQKLGMV